MGKFIDLTGERFGALVVMRLDIGYSGRDKKWICKCDCGKEVSVFSGNLRRGYTKSCGCLSTQSKKKRMTTHGMARTRLYGIWSNMKKRCYYKNFSSYKNYGERGISVCEEWQSFDHFYKWAIENGYSDDLTIERINVNGNYEPSNCKWATRAEQQRNKRNNHYFDYNGKTVTLAEMAEDTGIQRGTILWREKNWGGKNIVKPITPKNQYPITVDGKTMTIKEWAETLDIPHSTIYRRIDAGYVGTEILFGRPKEEESDGTTSETNACK